MVWITLLALADQHGEVQASIPGLADVARVTIKECEDALVIFLSPDPYSRNKTLEGRRIVEIPGGWSIVNYDLYRGFLSLDHRRALARERQARHRSKKRNAVTRDITRSNTKSRQAEAEAYTDKETTTTKAATPAGAEYSFMGSMRSVWKTAYGGTIPSGSAKLLKPFIAELGEEEVGRRLAVYCNSTEGQFASIRHFVNTIGTWKGDKNGQRLLGVGGDLTIEELASIGIKL